MIDRIKESKTIVLVVLAVILGLRSACVSGKVFTRCQLAKELLNQGFSKKDLREWVCLVEEVSECNTKRMEGPYKDDSKDVGLFQINTRFCKDFKPGGECNVLCGSLLSDNITKASKCAKYIHKNYGFEQWKKYKEKCIYYVPSLHSCGIRY